MALSLPWKSLMSPQGVRPNCCLTWLIDDKLITYNHGRKFVSLRVDIYWSCNKIGYFYGIIKFISMSTKVRQWTFAQIQFTVSHIVSFKNSFSIMLLTTQMSSWLSHSDRILFLYFIIDFKLWVKESLISYGIQAVSWVTKITLEHFNDHFFKLMLL
jgi:hypothetical protein